MWKILLMMTLMISANSAQMQLNHDTMCNVNRGVTYPYQNESSFMYQICGQFSSMISLYNVEFHDESFLKNSLSKCLNLQSIQIIGGNIPNIPARIAQFNSKMGNFALYNTNTLKIDSGAFVGLLQLQSLYMSYNKIECLPYDLFQNTPNLREMNFDCNRITALDVNLFRNLQYLERASFMANFIKTLPSFDLLTTSINPMITSMSFTLNYNPIVSINPRICDILKPTANPYSVFRIQLSGIQCQIYAYDIVYYNCAQPGYLQTCYNNWNAATYAPVQCL